MNPSDQNRWFIYGGLALDVDAMAPLHDRVAEIRHELGLKGGEPLKFSNRSRPSGVPQDAWTTAKSDVIQACADNDARFICCMVLHAIATGDTQQNTEFAVNTILSIFNFRYLPDHQTQGMVLIDRLPGNTGYNYLKKKFGEGIDLDGRIHELPNIVMYGSTCDGASHLSSAVDIVLGAFRFCINRSDDSELVRNLMPRVTKLMWYRQDGDTHRIRDNGLALRPQTVRVPAYKKEYDDLVERLTRLSNEPDGNS